MEKNQKPLNLPSTKNLIDLPTRQQAALARAGLCRRHLMDFSCAVMSDFDPAPHLRLAARYLERVESGEIPRLMIFMPPRHGKSTLACQMFPAWVLGRKPTAEVMTLAYSDDMAKHNSQHSQRIAYNEEYNHIFPEVFVRLKKQPIGVSRARMRSSAYEWHTSANGSMKASGIEGGITGRGANLLIIDDPVKNWEEAESLKKQEALYNEYVSTIRSRLAPHAKIVFCITRWHEMDLAGRILQAQKEGGEQWQVLSLPAIDEKREQSGDYANAPLWPGRYDYQALQNLRTTMTSRVWESLYQQRPTAPEGNRFAIDHVAYTPLEDYPAMSEARWCRYWDLASTEKDIQAGDPDFTCGALMAVTKDEKGAKHVWIRDVKYGQWSPMRRNERIEQISLSDGTGVPVVVEATGNYKESAESIKRELWGRVSVKADNPARDKETRAQPLEAIMEAGNFHVAEQFKDQWAAWIISQFKSFPRGTHDDAVDSISGGYNFLTKSHFSIS